MRLTQQERWIAGFLVITLMVGMGIRLTRHYLFSPNSSVSTSSIQQDSVFLKKVSLVDSLVHSAQLEAHDQSPAVQKMIDARQKLRININTADQQMLEQLPRIGPALAKRIIAHRSQNGYFTTIQDLQNVKGIGPATVSEFRPYIILERATP